MHRIVILSNLDQESCSGGRCLSQSWCWDGVHPYPLVFPMYAAIFSHGFLDEKYHVRMTNFAKGRLKKNSKMNDIVHLFFRHPYPMEIVT